MISYLSSHKKEYCSGCGACSAACPCECISLEQAPDGFLYPTIDKDRCISCQKCLQVCPYDTSATKHTVIKCLAAKTKDSSLLAKCSSGGCFGVLADTVIKDGGIVYGCALDSSYSCSHKKAETDDELQPLLGSKYLQSRCDEAFRSVKDSLATLRTVLFSGTPCQVAGLKNYLSGEYDNLICIDIACHGVPSNADFMQMIKHLERKHHGKLTRIKFRDKTKSGWKHALTYTIENNGRERTYKASPWKIPYYYFFLHSKNIRSSCYSCPYIGTERVGDITLADFWGSETIIPLSDIKGGISAVLCNTEKGAALLTKVSHQLFTWNASLDTVIRNNQPFKGHVKPYSKHDDLCTELIVCGYDGTIEKYYGTKERLIEFFKAAIPDNFKRGIKKAAGRNNQK